MFPKIESMIFKSRVVRKIIELCLRWNGCEIELDDRYSVYLMNKNRYQHLISSERAYTQERLTYMAKIACVECHFERVYNHLECSNCHNFQGLFNYDESQNEYCGICGYKLDWRGVNSQNKIVHFPVKGFAEYREFLVGLREQMISDIQKKDKEIHKMKQRNNPVVARWHSFNSEVCCPECGEDAGTEQGIRFCKKCGQLLVVDERYKMNGFNTCGE